jgi:hypothetical protein
MADEGPRGHLSRHEHPEVQRIARELRAGREPWGPDGPQTLTDWDECAAAWRANYRRAVTRITELEGAPPDDRP